MEKLSNLALPLKRVALYSSGVGFFEHRGEAVDSVQVALPFGEEAMSDVLKSLAVNDPACVAPSLSYPSRTHSRSSRIGAGGPDLPEHVRSDELFKWLRGTRLEVTTAEGTLVGRVFEYEEKGSSDEAGYAQLSLYVDGTIQRVDASKILSFRPLDDRIKDDIEARMDAQLGGEREPAVLKLPAEGAREVSLAFVTSAPVWKASYRLDLTDAPTLQGWAIVDNTSDTDWDEVQLSLFVGKPSSFTQALYDPIHIDRIVVQPQMRWRIPDDEEELESFHANAAGGVTDWEVVDHSEDRLIPEERLLRAIMFESRNYQNRPVPKTAGNSFAYTVPTPVNLKHGQSTMIPLVQGELKARKVSIWQAADIKKDADRPILGVQLENTTGAQLPAGAVTVYDDNLFAGDALLNFVPQNAERIIGYGYDLAVRCSRESESDDSVVFVKVVDSVAKLTFESRMRTTYTLVNESASARTLLIEHPREAGESLVVPVDGEKREKCFRIECELAPGETKKLLVETVAPRYEGVEIAKADEVKLLWASGAAPAGAAKDALEKALDLQRRRAKLRAALSESEKREKRLVDEQARIRENLLAVGVDSRSGANYQRRMEAVESRLDAVIKKQDEERRELQEVTREFGDFLSGLEI
ncbi:MAG: DUF4139 domain-containing protein [Propionibacteriaceae bacterium]|jgi:hypothetical protein|nr:DUF4139 domain-containing protein [Propionibacteriaceae bacterium]